MEKGGLLDMSINIILALIIPPASVYRQNGVDESFWLCVLLTLMVVIPGIDRPHYMRGLSHHFVL